MCALFDVAVIKLVQLLKMYILQGSVASHFGRGGILNGSFIANVSQSLPVKEFSKSVEN